MVPLLEKAMVKPIATHVTISGLEGSDEKEVRFSIEEIRANCVFWLMVSMEKLFQ